MENDTRTGMVVVFRSANHDAEMEALTVKGVLETGGIAAQLVGTKVLPVLEFQVCVPEESVAEAERLIAEAVQAGPAAAAEAEALTE